MSFNGDECDDEDDDEECNDKAQKWSCWLLSNKTADATCWTNTDLIYVYLYDMRWKREKEKIKLTALILIHFFLSVKLYRVQ